MRSWRIGFCRLQGFSRLSRLWPCWDSLSLDGNWNLAGFDSSSDLCDLSDFTKYLTGLKGIDPSLQEAGIAFGMTRWERLKKFEIPLAMPVMMSGIGRQLS